MMTRPERTHAFAAKVGLLGGSLRVAISASAGRFMKAGKETEIKIFAACRWA